MTSITEIEKAKKTLERITAVDREIINMQKMAKQLSELGSRAKFNMTVESAEKRLKDIDQKKECSRGNGGHHMEIGGMTFYIPGSTYDMPGFRAWDKINVETVPSGSYNLNSAVALRILDILLEEKIQKRQRLIHQLQIIFDNLNSEV